MRHLLLISLLLTLLVLLGTSGFMWIESWSFLDSLYMAVITLTTVGFEEVHELSDTGRAFVIFFLVAGLGVFFYGIAQIAELVLRTELGDWWERRKMERDLFGPESGRPPHCVREGRGDRGIDRKRLAAGLSQRSRGSSPA